MNCSTCYYARQACNKETTAVGCVKLHYDEKKRRLYVSKYDDAYSYDVEEASLQGVGDVYSGWFYTKRPVGQLDSKGNLGDGMMQNSCLIEGTQRCQKYRNKGNPYEI